MKEHASLSVKRKRDNVCVCIFRKYTCATQYLSDAAVRVGIVYVFISCCT